MVIEVSHGLVLWSVFSTQHSIELLQLLERYVALSPAMAAEKAIAKVPHLATQPGFRPGSSDPKHLELLASVFQILLVL